MLTSPFCVNRTKVLLSTLVRPFEFDLTVPGKDIDQSLFLPASGMLNGEEHQASLKYE